MTPRYAVLFARGLVLTAPSDGVRDVVLEIGLTEDLPLHSRGEAYAAFRIRPLTEWRGIYGVDPMQAVALAIQVGEQVADSLGADWPDAEADG